MSEAAANDRRRIRRFAVWVSFLAPTSVALLTLGVWEGVVRFGEVPLYVLPSPSVIGSTVVDQWPVLGGAWLVTLRTMAIALALAIVGGVALALLFSLSPALELSLFPYAVVLQVTPLVAVAPLLLVWLDYERAWLVLVLCAWIVAFFPILASTTVGLRSADPGLRDLLDLCGASRPQRVRLLLAPTALPYFLAGLRTAVNLSLVGTVVAEFVTGAGGEESGLAAVVFQGQFRMDTPLMFAALGLISLTGIACYFSTHLLSSWLLAGWHESSV